MLVWKFFKKQWVIQMAVVLLLVSAIVVLALYGAYLNRQQELLAVRIQAQMPSGYMLAKTASLLSTEPALPPYRGMREPPITLVASWRREVLPSSLGSVLFSLLSEGFIPTFTLTQDTVAIPQGLAESFSLSVGEDITIKLGAEERRLKITHVHDGLVFGDSLVALTAISGGRNAFLYSEDPAELRSDLIRYAHRVFPQGALEDVESTTALAQEIVGANYAPAAKARVELMGFVTIAYLSSSLLAFLERRRVLAILKATGLKASELMAIIAGENSIAPGFAAILGLGVSTGVLLWLRAVGTGLTPTIGLIVSSVLGIVPAVVVGIIIPARFTQMATVNQLLFEQPIPMFYAQIRGLQRRYPAIETEVERGVRFVRLDVDNGEFFGFIFRKVGDTVKAGEVLAVQNDWAGLRVREYVAPVSGVVVRLQEETGFIGIMPENHLRVGGSE
ncbi:MAG: hypothetical protein KGZ53_05165 [Peptococcaceae bacterium]|nr:hypothetical protein [Peptococcaceae bacterium]